MFFFHKAKKNPSAVSLRACLVSDVGLVRKNNEDNFLLCGQINESLQDRCTTGFLSEKGDRAWKVMGVFDGMGGGRKGELAARAAAEIFRDLAGELGTEDTAAVDERMRKGFLDANNKVTLLQKDDLVYGTTGTVACIGNRAFKIYHLGDSRAYLLRDGRLLRLTKDQTLAQMKIDAGLYREDDPRAKGERHKLTEYIGRDWTGENLRPQESRWMPLKKNDRLLLCSDGLYDMCPHERMESVLQETADVEKAALALMETALKNGGEDNVTCLVAVIDGVSSKGP